MLSTEITDEGYFVQYARANRSLVRARLRKWDEALEDAEATTVICITFSTELALTPGHVKSHGDQAPLIAYIAKGIALCGQGKREGALDAFDAVLRECDSDTKNVVEHIKVSCNRETSFQLLNSSLHQVHHLFRGRAS